MKESRFILVLCSIALSVSPVLAQLNDVNVSQLKKNSSGGNSVAGSVVQTPVGEKDASTSNQMVQEAAGLLKQNAKDIVHFINDKGCIPNGGKVVPLNETAFKRAVDASVPTTEALFNVGQGVMTRLTGQPMAWGVGITKEIKPTIEQQQGIKLGTAGKNTIVLKVKPNGGGARFAHEFLHIVLRQLDNPALGGGKYKGKECKFIAKTHHQLTDYLAGQDSKASPDTVDRGWSQFKQAPEEWTPSTTDYSKDATACQAPDTSALDGDCDGTAGGAPGAGTSAPGGGSTGGAGAGTSAPGGN